MIVIIDYGMGNLGSVVKALKRLTFDVCISSDRKKIESANKIIFPGVGNFTAGMNNLKKYNILDILNEKIIKRKVPTLGICLGMQLLTEWGEEGDSQGLGWVKGKTIKFKFSKKDSYLKVPHIGWNSLQLVKSNILTRNISNNDVFYFAHSYYVLCKNKQNVVAKTNYGYDFNSIIQNGNIFGVQFHPEKSHSSGMRLLENFVKYA